MKKVLVALLAFGLFTPAAYAGDDLSASEQKEVAAMVARFGCEGGRFEKQSYGYEVEDAICAGERYEIKLDWSYKLIKLERD